MYQITYYADRAGRVRLPETDRISDRAIDDYPAPRGKETAYARHSNDRSLDRYGHDGKWHDIAPSSAPDDDDD